MTLAFAKNLPIRVASGIEISSLKSSDEPISWQKKDKPSSLNLICGPSKDKHLVLVTRLPFPRSFEHKVSSGSRENATLFVDGIHQMLQIVFDLTSVGKKSATLGNHLGITEDEEPDTAFSAPLKYEQVEALAEWFGTTPPKRVGVSGLVETGVFMHGRVTGKVIRAFAASCPS
ncbi:MAG: hypothetical protein EOP23_12000 [Hyphomicrobiales bacterium]|nr:MAG: hypothetical protein EOP23_12000 [Hyphomicrobiales bacterium]